MEESVMVPLRSPAWLRKQPARARTPAQPSAQEERRAWVVALDLLAKSAFRAQPRASMPSLPLVSLASDSGLDSLPDSRSSREATSAVVYLSFGDCGSGAVECGAEIDEKELPTEIPARPRPASGGPSSLPTPTCCSPRRPSRYGSRGGMRSVQQTGSRCGGTAVASGDRQQLVTQSTVPFRGGYDGPGFR
ncbi:hypothetical protein PAHAL_9G266100 [Panicum hallii]|uniref:Uncharacterized protein n=1 Tax=Panicum hallii TaxID=206008 RepID=A0A2T8I2M6_9POAL|nr:hypothetical protein PAHAL_9G266100 [Panicum hallii]PVH31927.1 hypothetical protein PAHAL_9G266100 [Panicum hallii]PVH31928.1 hypothetical protein PAHAL_9G266100 [Panicum hallii]PVH31929.1 hypothetical protein PAHAL_9G266100 [Panicum hallii]PVH31930.1 hypothetical protein PAHAL_9G266100 [Panicum hallii]